MTVVIIVLGAAMALWAIHYAFTAQERRGAMQEFEAALEELRKDPDSRAKRDAAMVRGKTYWSVRRNGRPVREEDEKAVTERIRAVIYRDTLPANRSATRIGPSKISNSSNLRRTKIEYLENGTWNVSGRTRIRQLREELGLKLEDEGQETLGGLVERRLMRVPKFGDHVVIGNLDIAVTKVEDDRASKLFIRRLDSAEF